MSMYGLEMVISWLEIQRDEHASLLMRKFDGACTQPGQDWLKRKSIASFSQGLANATRMMENVHTSMIHLKLQSAPNFCVVHAQTSIAT